MQGRNAESSGGWGENFESHYNEITAAYHAGEVRETIPCAEVRREWFVMARDMYVGNNPQPRAVLDFEIGLHIGSCPTEACQLLLRAVGSLLVPSHPDDHIQLGAAIDALEAAMPSEEDK